MASTDLPPFGTVHFIAIGGIGMSSIAEILHALGYKVQGSDIAENANVTRLRGLGIKAMVGHSPDNLGDAAVVVVSTAIKPDNPELLAARERKIPVLHRSEMLAELMRMKQSVAVAGTHGKTTTTALVGTLLERGGLDPTIVNGGIITSFTSNARYGNGPWLVAEADESDGSFVNYHAQIGVITNIQAEHLEQHGDSMDNLRAAFRTFVKNIPFYGLCFVCIDDPETKALYDTTENRRLISYGFSKEADIRAENVTASPEGMRFTAVYEGRSLPIRLNLHGEHNVKNALPAIGIALRLGVTPEVIRETLETFAGVKRRFTFVGETRGISVIDDYAHHPEEIKATLSAARNVAKGRIIAVFQPHRYSRVHNLFDDFCTCFALADEVVVADVYAAGETPIPGATGDDLCAGIAEKGGKKARKLASPEELPEIVAGIAGPGDMVLCLGAGSVSNWAYALPKQLEALAKRTA